jgi:hypothetical protein
LGSPLPEEGGGFMSVSPRKIYFKDKTGVLNFVGISDIVVLTPEHKQLLKQHYNEYSFTPPPSLVLPCIRTASSFNDLIIHFPETSPSIGYRLDNVFKSLRIISLLDFENPVIFTPKMGIEAPLVFGFNCMSAAIRLAPYLIA